LGYRVNTKRGTEFRIWATKTLKEYLLRGYAINHRFEQIDNKLFRHEQKLQEHQKQIDFIVRTDIPPKEGIFYNGQIFDAYRFASECLNYDFNMIFLITQIILQQQNHINHNNHTKIKVQTTKMEMKANDLLKNI
jgi:hypothetical protein